MPLHTCRARLRRADEVGRVRVPHRRRPPGGGRGRAGQQPAGAEPGGCGARGGGRITRRPVHPPGLGGARPPRPGEEGAVRRGWCHRLVEPGLAPPSATPQTPPTFKDPTFPSAALSPGVQLAGPQSRSIAPRYGGNLREVTTLALDSPRELAIASPRFGPQTRHPSTSARLGSFTSTSRGNNSAKRPDTSLLK